jgi:hypothetical protein
MYDLDNPEPNGVPIDCILGEYNGGWDYSERREFRDVIRKPYKRPNEKENCPRTLPRDYLRTLGKGVLY